MRSEHKVLFGKVPANQFYTIYVCEGLFIFQSDFDSIHISKLFEQINRVVTERRPIITSLLSSIVFLQFI